MVLVPKVERHDWGKMSWLAYGEEMGVCVAIMQLNPLAVAPIHRHDNCNEIVHVLEGGVEYRQGNDWMPLSMGQSVLMTVGAVHQFRNVKEAEAQAMIVYSTGDREYEECTF